MYSLYCNKSESKIEIKKQPEGKFYLLKQIEGEEVYKYNDCYYICKERKPLAKLGNKIKNDWIDEQQKILLKLKGIKNFRE